VTVVALAAPSLPGIITSVTGVVSAFGVVVGAIAGIYQIRRMRAETSGRLDVIHTLVNSTLTAAIESDLDGTRVSLAMMRDLSAGHEPSAEMSAAMHSAEAKISRLTQQMADRLHSAEQVLAQARDDNPRT